MICGAYIKSGKNKNCICQVKGKDKYNGRCGNHRDRSKKACSPTPTLTPYECHICMETLEGNKVIFKCGHHMCGGCWADMRVLGESNCCPMCRGDCSGFTVEGKNIPHMEKCIQDAHQRKNDSVEQSPITERVILVNFSDDSDSDDRDDEDDLFDYFGINFDWEAEFLLHEIPYRGRNSRQDILLEYTNALVV